MKNLARLLLISLLSALAVGLIACGGGGDSTDVADLGPDPATMAPADSPVYVDAVVRPSGSMGDDLESALSKLLATDDPGAKITAAFDEGVSNDGYSYGEDVEPWLGARAGAFFTGYDAQAEEPQGAAVVAVTDAAAAQAFLDKVAESQPGTEEDLDYEGVSYKLDEDGVASGIDGDFLVVGPEQSFKDAVDAGAGESLAENDDVNADREPIPSDSLFSLYIDTPAVLDLIKRDADLSPADLKAFELQIANYDEGPVTAWGRATSETMELGSVSPAAKGSTEPSALIESFPFEAWLAFSVGGLGDQIQAQFQQISNVIDSAQSGVGDLPSGFDSADLNAKIREKTGLDLSSDFDWMGDGGGFVEGSSLFGLGGALVIEATDEEGASSALEKIRTALSKESSLQVSPTEGSGFQVQIPPVSAEVSLQDGKVVAAVGAASTEDALDPSETLGDSDPFAAARSSLGEDLAPSFYLSFPAVVSLIESTGEVTSDPDYQSAKPYLGALDYLITGTSIDGDQAMSRVVLGLQESTGGEAETTAATLTP